MGKNQTLSFLGQHKKRINHQPCIRNPDNNKNGFALLECKDSDITFFRVLIDKT